MRDLHRLDDSLGFVRKHPEMFFASGQPEPLACIQHLIVEVLALGGADAQVNRVDDWWVVLSSFDWFGERDVHETFARIIPLPVVGQNASRVEVVVAAFADSVSTFGARGGRVVVHGTPPSDAVWDVMMRGTRAVAFRFAG